MDRAKIIAAFANALPLVFRGNDTRRFDARRVNAQSLTSAQWAHVSHKVRESSFFSSKVSDAKLLEKMQGYISRAAQGATGTSRGDFIKTMRNALNAPKESQYSDGALTDITSSRRLGLIFDFQKEKMQGEIFAEQSKDDDMVWAYPAYELVRESRALRPRDWETRWIKAGGKIRFGKMVALRNDPIWRKISRFGNPYPPFDFNSGMGLREVSRAEAISLKLVPATGMKAPDAQAPQEQEDAPEEKINYLQYDIDLGAESYTQQLVDHVFSVSESQINADGKSILKYWAGDDGFEEIGAELGKRYSVAARAGKLPPKSDVLKRMEAAFDRASFPESMQIVRDARPDQMLQTFGVLKSKSISGITKELEMLAGKTVPSNRFVAGSIGQEFDPSRKFVMLIDVPKGAKALGIKSSAVFTSEEEVLIANDQKYKVHEVKKLADGRIFVHVELKMPKNK